VWQADGRTNTGWRLVQRFRTAPRGKNTYFRSSGLFLQDAMRRHRNLKRKEYRRHHTAKLNSNHSLGHVIGAVNLVRIVSYATTPLPGVDPEIIGLQVGRRTQHDVNWLLFKYFSAKDDNAFWQAWQWRKRYCSSNWKTTSSLNGKQGDVNVCNEFTEEFRTVFQTIAQ